MTIILHQPPQSAFERVARRLPGRAILAAVRQQVAANHSAHRELASPVYVRGRAVHTAEELAEALANESDHHPQRKERVAG